MEILKDIMVYSVISISFVVNLVGLYYCMNRIKTMKELPPHIISEILRTKNLTKLEKNKKILLILLGLGIASAIMPIGIFKFLLPGVSIVIVTNLLLDIFEEINVFDVTKEEIDTIIEFKQNRRKETQDKAKKREELKNKMR